MPDNTPPSLGYYLPSICYAIAYFGLPRFAFKDYDKVMLMFTDTPPWAGPYFYLLT